VWEKGQWVKREKKGVVEGDIRENTAERKDKPRVGGGDEHLRLRNGKRRGSKRSRPEIDRSGGGGAEEAVAGAGGLAVVT
jgi:hypothetical protein